MVFTSLPVRKVPTFHQNFFPHIILAIPNVYLILTDKTNGAVILMIIKRLFTIIYIKSIYENVIIHKLTFTLFFQYN